MAYPTLDDLLEASATEDLTGASPAEQTTYYVLAIQAVESYTGQRFESEDAVERVDGSGGSEVYLPRRLLTLDSVAQVDGDALDLTNFDVAVGVNSARLVWAALDTSYYAQAMRAVQGWVDTRTFRTGVRNLLIAGTWGWEDPPPEVVAAIRLDMEDQAGASGLALAGTIHAYRRLGVRDVSQGNLRLTLDPIAAQSLSPRAAALVHHLIWTGPAGWRA